jgi:hypothetical protein
MDPDPRSPVNSNRAGDVTLSLSFPGSTGVELGVRKGAIHIAVELGELTFDVVCGQQHFQRSAPAEIVLWAATRRQARRRPPIAKGSPSRGSRIACRWRARTRFRLLALIGFSPRLSRGLLFSRRAPGATLTQRFLERIGPPCRSISVAVARSCIRRRLAVVHQPLQ